MPLEQILVLAVVQGLTEFLPISSSGHLILVPILTGWRDQGLLTDVMVHLGSLLAVFVYFWRDVVSLAQGGLALLRGKMTEEGRLLLYIIAATLPAIAFGLFLEQAGLMQQFRSPFLIACNAIVFGLLMLAADWLGAKAKTFADMRLVPALIIGIAQAIAIIPGTSRSGITITAARALGFTRTEAARFSFLLGIPAIAGAGALVISDAVQEGVAISFDAILTGALTFFTALAAIAFLMAIVKRFSLLPFVIYRLLLGLALLWLIDIGILQS